ncbi:MAG: hypothetical protein ACRDL3_00910 [Solirubrobacterales bacterium]
MRRRRRHRGRGPRRARHRPRRDQEPVRPDGGAARDGEPDSELRAEAARTFATLEKEAIRRRIAVEKKRPDGRATDQIRPIETEVDLAPRDHGSALFTRGETQILSTRHLLPTAGCVGEYARYREERAAGMPTCFDVAE